MVLLAIAETDAFAISMIAVILLGFGVVGMLLLCMARNACRRNPEVDELLDEVATMEKPKAATLSKSSTPKKEPWEKDADWWKA